MENMLIETSKDCHILKQETEQLVQDAKRIIFQLLEKRDLLAKNDLGDKHYQRMREATLNTMSNALDEAQALLDQSVNTVESAVTLADRLVDLDLREIKKASENKEAHEYYLQKDQDPKQEQQEQV